MVDMVAIFTELTRRNAVRPEARLPLLDMRAEFVHAVEVAAWREACVKHADDMTRIRIETIADLGHRHGNDFGYSVGGHWAISIEVSKRFNALLAAYGVHPPTTRRPVVYGSDRSEDDEETFRPPA
jgi:hypothetical protein